MGGEVELVEYWQVAAADVEWLCHAGIGRLFAPWDEGTRREYARHARALDATVSAMECAGALRSDRAVRMREAIAAHGSAYGARATLEEMHQRDRALRAVFEPPAPFLQSVRAAVPVPVWPLPRFVPTPPRPAAPWRR